MSAPAWLERARAVRLLVLDVDGVLTDGTLYYGEHGEALKAFHVHDGLGLKLLRLGGIQVAVITARTGPALARRLHDLDVKYAWTGRADKGVALDELSAALKIAPSEMAFVGDDITDLPAMRKVGLAISVANGQPMVRAASAWITTAAGGRGAVREVADGLLHARGRLEETVEAYLLGGASP